MGLEITPLSGSDFAAAVTGVDFTAVISADLAATLQRAFRDHPVLVMRTDGLTSEQLLTVANVFGEPQVQLLEEYRSSGSAAISIVSSEQTDVRGDGRRLVFGGHWHTDDSYLALPAKATMLYAHIVPARGGDTLFADTTAAYQALDAARRGELEGMRVVHAYQSRRNVNAVPTRSAAEEARTPPVDHPIVRTDGDTARRSLYLNPNRMQSIVGRDDAASDAVLDSLIDHATQDRFVYRHRWLRHDIVVWDNGRSMHRATADYGDARREMHRILLCGSVPV